MSSIIVHTPPDAEPVTVATVKNHLRVSISDDDTVIGMYLQAARETVEGESGRSLVNKLYRQSHDRFPYRELSPYAAGGNAIKLLRCPLVSVQKITYIDTAGDLQTLLPAPEAWQPEKEYEKGAQVTDGTHLQELTSDDGESGSATPSWNASLSGETTDGPLTWTNKGASPAGAFIQDRDSEPPQLTPLYGQSWPATQHVPNAVQIYFTAGYGDDAADAPATLKVAVMMATGVSYENREAVTAEDIRTLDWYDRLIYSQRVMDFNPTP